MTLAAIADVRNQRREEHDAVEHIVGERLGETDGGIDLGEERRAQLRARQRNDGREREMRRGDQ